MKRTTKKSELYKRELAKLKGDFFKKYPSADMSKFDFQLSVAKDGTLESSDVYYMVDDISALICGAYIASYLSGISLLNLENESNLITSFVRYHLYYQIRKFMRHPELIITTM